MRAELVPKDNSIVERRFLLDEVIRSKRSKVSVLSSFEFVLWNESFSWKDDGRWLRWLVRGAELMTNTVTNDDKELLARRARGGGRLAARRTGERRSDKTARFATLPFDQLTPAASATQPPCPPLYCSRLKDKSNWMLVARDERKKKRKKRKKQKPDRDSSLLARLHSREMETHNRSTIEIRWWRLMLKRFVSCAIRYRTN